MSMGGMVIAGWSVRLEPLPGEHVVQSEVGDCLERSDSRWRVLVDTLPQLGQGVGAFQ